MLVNPDAHDSANKNLKLRSSPIWKSPKMLSCCPLRFSKLALPLTTRQSAGKQHEAADVPYHAYSALLGERIAYQHKDSKPFLAPGAPQTGSPVSPSV